MNVTWQRGSSIEHGGCTEGGHITADGMTEHTVTVVTITGAAEVRLCDDHILGAWANVEKAFRTAILYRGQPHRPPRHDPV